VADFRERYESEALSGFAEKTDTKVSSVFNAVEEILNPNRLREVNADRLSYHQAELRKRGLAETTIKSHLAHILAALNWAKRVRLLVEVPEIGMPKRAKGSKTMKGRPIARESSRKE